MKKNFVSVFLIAFALAACQAAQENLLDQVLINLANNRQKWAAAGIHNYSFDYDFTANIFSPPLHIEVRNDLVTQVTDRSSGATYSNSGAPTVDSLFVRAEAAIRSPNADVKITYDSQRGFPVKIEDDATTPDTGSITTVSNFQTVP